MFRGILYLDTRVKDKLAGEKGRTMSKVTNDDLILPSKIKKKKKGHLLRKEVEGLKQTA